MHPFFTLNARVIKTKQFLTDYPTYTAEQVASFLNLPLADTKRFLYSNITQFNRTTCSPPHWYALRPGHTAIHNGKDWDWESSV
jgi:hypothetical protein